MSALNTPQYYSKEEIETLYQVSRDPFLFSNFIWVVNPVKGRVKFDLYPYQKSVLYQFVKERFVIILKFRQGGITELISMYCLWLALYHPNKRINIISIKDTVAKKVLRKIKFMYKNLPWYLQTPIVNGRAGEFGGVTEIIFSNGSIIESIPTSEQAGRSESLSLLVIDEAAAVRWAEVIWASAFPTLSCAIGSTPIFVRGYKEIKKGHPKPSLQINKLKDICPVSKGVMDISHLNLYTLTHKGSWEKILYSQNKGKLETWFVVDKYGKKLGATPKHRLSTTHGWKTLEEIIEKDLNVIQVNTKVSSLKSPKKVECPSEEVVKPIHDFPGYFVSNLGKVYSQRRGFREIKGRANKDGYLRVGLTKPGVYRNPNSRKHKTYQRSIHKLVAEAFLGTPPKGSQIDHINCIRTDNFSTNLRYVSTSYNVKRSYKYSLGAIIQPITGSRLPNLTIRGRILELHELGYSSSQIAKLVYPNRSCGHKFVKRILVERGSNVYISKLRIVKKCTRTIYDIHVENHESYISANNYVNHNTGGSAIINSTPLGLGGWYHSMWVDALSGGNGFTPLRLRWDMHPERDIEWYKSMAKALGPRRTAQEIDGDFLGSGNTVFDLTDIKAIEEDLNEYPPLEYRFNNQYRRYLDPDPNAQYFIGADIATGRGNDYSSFTCMDREGEEAAVYKGRMPIDRFAKLLGDTGILFNNAVIAPESNDVGIAVTNKLQDEGYPNLYYSTQILKKKRGGRRRLSEAKVPGWITTTKNRTFIIEGLEEDVRKENVIIKDPFFVHEAYTFIYENGRPVAMGKGRQNKSSIDTGEDSTYSDDDILGKSITNYIRKSPNYGVIVTPQ